MWVKLAVVCGLVVFSASTALAAMVDIPDLKKKPDRYLNQTVTVQGQVTGFREGTAWYPWIYDIVDEAGETITVRSTAKVPPEKGKLRVVSGIVKPDPNNAMGIYLLESRSYLPYIWIGIGVLALLAVALIYQLVRRPELPELVPAAETVPETRTDIGGLVVGYCSSCSEPLRQGWTSCPKCGTAVAGQAVAAAPAQPARAQESARMTRLLPSLLGELLLQTGSRDRIPLDKVSMTIGRDPSNDIVFDEDTVSRHHARIRFEDSQFIMRDLDSANKTYVNGEVVQERELKDGDEVAFGPFIKAIFKSARMAPSR
jgi:uncharacterized Zn finger protein (UPF0148 family)